MKKNLFRKNNRHFHINLDFQCHPIFQQLDWIFLQKKIFTGSEDFQISIHALVMMDTHIHLLINSNQKKENYFCERLQKEISPGSQFNESQCEPILTYPQYLNTYRYIFRNPVAAGLAKKTEEYLYSSLQFTLGKQFSHCPIVDQLGLIQNPIQVLRWLNLENDFKASAMSWSQR